MDIILIFTIVGIILAVGFLAEILFRKTGIPDVLILIAFGMILRYGFKIASPESFGDGAVIFTTFALLYILFQGSLSINFRSLAQNASSALKLTLGTFFVSVTVVAALAYSLSLIGDYFGVILAPFNPMTAILIGTILGGTSSMVIVPMLQNMGTTGKTRSLLVLESAISDVLCILASLTIVEAITTGNVVASEVTRSLFTSFGLAIIVGAAVGILWILLIEKFTSLSRAYVLSIGLILILYAFVESNYVGASGPIACLVFGLMLKNSKYIIRIKQKDEAQTTETEDIKQVLTPEAKNFYSEISFFLKATFFVYLGVLINIHNIPALIMGALFVFVLYLIRPLLVRKIFAKDEEIQPMDKTFIEVMIPKGLAAFVLAQFAANAISEIPGYELVASVLTDVSLAGILASILITSALVFSTKKGWFHGFFNKPTLLLDEPITKNK